MTSSRMVSPAITRPGIPEKRTTLWAAIPLKFVPVSVMTSPAFTVPEESASRVGGSTAHASKRTDFSGKSRIEARTTYLPRSSPSRSRALANPVESLEMLRGVSCTPTGPETISQSRESRQRGDLHPPSEPPPSASRSRTEMAGRTDHPLLPLST